MKKIIRDILPESIRHSIYKTREYIKLKKEFKKDMKKFVVHSYVFSKQKTKRHLEADLIFYYHKFEKGLSLPNPKIGFGKANIKRLIVSIKRYVKLYGWDNISVNSLNSLEAYYKFNKENGLDMKELYEEISKFRSDITEQVTTEGGVIEITKKEIQNAQIDFKKFAYNRYSIRNFTSEAVSIDQIKEAVEIAQKSPSVCNRQPSKVYVFNKKMDKEKILKYQNGNAGFGNTADIILLITTNLKDFRGVIERNQAYIEGGIYSMSLIYALHSLNLGTCPLNLSITNDVEEKLKEAANISESEIPIMMIAVGHIPEKLKVANSPRRSAEDSMTIC